MIYFANFLWIFIFVIQNYPLLEPDSLPEIFRNLKIINPDEKIVFCKKCVMSNQRPQVHFNDEGICGQCLNSEYKKTMVIS